MEADSERRLKQQENVKKFLALALESKIKNTHKVSEGEL